MLLDVRGTHGSGKSWLAQRMLALGHEDITEVIDRVKRGKLLKGVERVIGQYVPSLKLAMVGRYTVKPGGCDGIKKGVNGNTLNSGDEICRRIRLFVERYENVFLEGIISGHSYQRYADLSAELERYDYRFLFFNTPLRTCVARVRARRHLDRVRSPNHYRDIGAFNPSHVIKDYHVINDSVRGKLVKDGRCVKVLDYRDPVSGILKELAS